MTKDREIRKFCRERAFRCWVWLRPVALALAVLLGTTARSSAQDVIAQEEPTPSSVDEITTPIERAFRAKASPGRDFSPG
jgi:hypothetical protein